MIRRIHRYRVLMALTAVLVAVGVIFGTPALIVAGGIPLVYVVQGALATGSPIAGRVAAKRSVEPKTPIPGQPVEVTLTVTNTGESSISDLRFVDGVPTELATVEGSARGSGSLRPGESTSISYSVIADRGAYEFGAVTLRARNVSGSILTATTQSASGDTQFESRVAVEDVPIQRQTMAFTGPLATNTGGPGIEFYATREYRSGDPVKRINWNRYAKSDELSTIEYREQRASRVAVVIDSRPSAHVASRESYPTGATVSSYAATLALGVLIDEGHHVAVAALGLENPIDGSPAPAWASSDEGAAFTSRAATICNAAASGTNEGETTAQVGLPMMTDGGDSALDEHHRLLSRFSADTQVLLCTPALDDGIAELAGAIRSQGHELTVVSPQIVGESIGGRIAALHRQRRLASMKTLGATVIDWDQDEQLPMAIARMLVRDR